MWQIFWCLDRYVDRYVDVNFGSETRISAGLWKSFKRLYKSDFSGGRKFRLLIWFIGKGFEFWTAEHIYCCFEQVHILQFIYCISDRYFFIRFLAVPRPLLGLGREDGHGLLTIVDYLIWPEDHGKHPRGIRS